MLKQHVYGAGADAKPSRRSRVKNSRRRSTTYSATYVAGLKARNRIYLAILAVKAIVIVLLSIGGSCE